MSRLDDAISETAYILDTLMAYRQIVQSGDCNSCAERKICKYAPELGELVRYNCPFYKRRTKNEPVQSSDMPSGTKTFALTSTGRTTSGQAGFIPSELLTI